MKTYTTQSRHAIGREVIQLYKLSKDICSTDYWPPNDGSKKLAKPCPEARALLISLQMALNRCSRPDQTNAGLTYAHQLLETITFVLTPLLTLLLIQSCILCRRRWRESVEPAAKGRWEAVGGSGWEGGGEQEGEEGGGGEEGKFVEEKRGENWRAGKRRLWTLLAWCRSKWCFLLEQELQQRTKKSPMLTAQLVHSPVTASNQPSWCYALQRCCPFNVKNNKGKNIFLKCFCNNVIKYSIFSMFDFNLNIWQS